MSVYSDSVLRSAPALYWRLDEASGTAIADSSSNGRTGKIYTNQAVGTSGVTLAVPSGVKGGDKALQLNAHWTDASTQVFPGTGVRADAYKPYQVGASLTMECWAKKTDPVSFATLFTGSGGTGGNGSPHPTLEWGGIPTSPGVGQQFCRWYGTVGTYPVGWVDFGDTNTQSNPRNDFTLNHWHHIAFTFNDVTSIAELFIDGRSQGPLGPQAFNGTGQIMHFNTSYDPGYFQIGWRGGAPSFADPGNTECWGGALAHVAVYERILPLPEIRRHWEAGVQTSRRLQTADYGNLKQSIDAAFPEYFRLDR